MAGLRRRTFVSTALAGAAAAGIGALAAACSPGSEGTVPAGEGSLSGGPGEGAVQRHKYQYGEDPSQFGELYLPELPDGGARRGVVVVIHGGYWRSQYGAELGEPLAKDLAAHGMAAWNLEYRRAGNGGGWPNTFADVLAGIDKLADLAADHSLDLDRVVALGHSAGGHLAVWAAGRDRLAQLGLPDADRQVLRDKRQRRGPAGRRGQPVRAAQPGRGPEAGPQQRCREQPAGRVVVEISAAPQVRRPDDGYPAGRARPRGPRGRRHHGAAEPVRVLRCLPPSPPA